MSVFVDVIVIVLPSIIILSILKLIMLISATSSCLLQFPEHHRLSTMHLVLPDKVMKK